MPAREANLPRSDDLTLTDPLLRSGTRERLLKLDGEIDILEKDRLDRDTPFLSSRLDLDKVNPNPD